MQPSTLLYKNYVNLLIVWITAMNMLMIYKILIKIAPFEAYVPITEPTSLIVTSLKLFSLTIISLTFKAFSKQLAWPIANTLFLFSPTDFKIF